MKPKPSLFWTIQVPTAIACLGLTIVLAHLTGWNPLWLAVGVGAAASAIAIAVLAVVFVIAPKPDRQAMLAGIKQRVFDKSPLAVIRDRYVLRRETGDPRRARRPRGP